MLSMRAVTGAGVLAGMCLAAGCTAAPAPPPVSLAGPTQQRVLEQMAAQHARAVADGSYRQQVDLLTRRAATSTTGQAPVGAIGSLVSVLSTPQPGSASGWTTQPVTVTLPSPTAAPASEMAANGTVTQQFPSYSGVTVVPAYDGKVWSATLQSPSGDVCAVFADSDRFDYQLRAGNCGQDATAAALVALARLGTE